MRPPRGKCDWPIHVTFAPPSWVIVSDSTVQTARGCASAFSRHKAPELCVASALHRTKGAGKAGCTLHPRSRVPARRNGAHEHRGPAEASRLSLRDGLRLTSCSSRRTALLPPSPPRSLLLENLTPAPRRQNHTTSPYASASLVSHGFASTASHRTFVTIASRPLAG
jgi:hypothetical protein